MAWGIGYHGGMRKYLVQDVRMEPADWAVDVIVAAGAFGFACLQLTFANSLIVPDELLRRLFGLAGPPSPAFALAAAALTTLPLVARRRFPWPVLAATLAVWALAQPAVGAAALSLVGPLIALFTVALERPRIEALGAALAMAAVVLLGAFDGAGGPPVPGAGSALVPGRGQGASALTLIQNLAFTAVAAVAGYAMQARQDFLRAAEARAEEAERTREALARQRVEEERLRIAREVHDITAHSLTAVSVQAAAAERLVDADPGAAKEAIAQVRAISKGALDEIRAMVGVLRTGDAAPAAETAPIQGTDRLVDLRSFLEGFGVACAIDEQAYDRGRMPAYVDVALFSVAREAATNVARHARARHASIRLSLEGDEAVLEVRDDGCGLPSPGASGQGHGIEGMGERIGLLGGSVAVEPAPQGGTRVEARVPLPAAGGE